MPEDRYKSLKLENQLCFPLYAASREIIKRYTPFLDNLGLTYTQYIAMMVLWEKQTLTVKEMGELLYLDSGTLTPLLKKMEAKGLLVRARSTKDERILNISITQAGQQLREKALCIPSHMAQCSILSLEEAKTLYRILYKILLKKDSSSL